MNLQKIKKIFNKQKNLLLNLSLIFIAGIYFFQFASKGLVISDPGYYAYNAERIINGGKPYVDFFIQFPPGYFYILALVFKIFGVSILTARYFTLFICLGIVFVVLKIMEALNISSVRVKILTVFSLVAFGYPLINNAALLAWVSVFVSLLITYCYIKVCTAKKKNRWLILLGLFLAMLFFIKQNLALYFFIVINFLILKTFSENIFMRIKKLLYVNLIVFFVTFIWVYYFFLTNGLNYLQELIAFSGRYLQIYPFSYPPLSMIVSRFGIFKLIPYYLPLIFTCFVLYDIFFAKKKKESQFIGFALISVVGFAGTVYPTSDLLHVYPFFGMVLAAIIAFFYRQKRYYLWVSLVMLTIFIGFYLTFFKEYYRYYLPYHYQNSKLDLPKTQGIFVDKEFADSAHSVYIFLNKYTEKGDTVLMYPFCETLYFIFDRESSSKYLIYYPGYRNESEENGIIRAMNEKRTKLIVTFGDYKFNTRLSEYIQEQKKVFEEGQFKIFSTKYASGL